MSLYNNYIFPFTEQKKESSLPLLLDVIFGMIFPFQSALGILKKLFKCSLFVSLFIPILINAVLHGCLFCSYCF